MARKGWPTGRRRFTDSDPKKCNRCEETKLRSEFRFNKSSQQYSYICKPCENANRVIKQRENRDAYNRRCREWRKRPEVKARLSAYHKALYPKIKERLRVGVLTRIARKKAAGGTFTVKQIRGMLVAQSHQCVACRADISAKFHIDHIVPLSAGGHNGIENIQLLCPPCNMSKGAKSMEVFMQQREQQ